jgi:DEAD/DEAH box helicase domain-containing protein
MSRSVIDEVSRVLEGIPGTTIHYAPEPSGPTAGRFIPLDSVGLHPTVTDALGGEYPAGLFSHQGLALGHILNGDHTVVSTRTSSGKSLIYSLPVLDSLLRDSESTALFIYPQKALANDQLSKMRALASRLAPLTARLTDQPHFISRYDGATPKDIRPAIREQAGIVLTNPDMLHIGLLPHHDGAWARFFSRLRYVIIDECHEYRGVFGVNVAYTLRRLRQACEIHGSSATFVATSATIHEPREHLEKLTGLSFSCVGADDDGSTQGRKRFWMLSGGDHFYDLGRKLGLSLAQQGLSVLTFCPSRLAAERMTERVVASNDEAHSFVKVYRAGLKAAEREAIEAGLKEKTVRLVFSTNALELGIDIGALDIVLCVGLPSSMMSLWQRAGRVARAGKEGAIILIPADTPIDSYFASQPRDLFERTNEPLALNLQNRRVAFSHFACAVSEVGGADSALRLNVLGDTMATISNLRAAGDLNDDIFYRTDPHSVTNIRSMGDGSYSLLCGRNEIGEIDSYHLLREAYRNAIYRHGGEAYRVKDVIKSEKTVRLERDYSGNETTPFIQKQIRLKHRRAVADYSQLAVARVDVDITEFLISVVEKDRSGKIVRQWPGAAGMPAHMLPTVATQLLIRPVFWTHFVSDLGDGRAKNTLAACERLVASLFPTVSGPCDLQDYSSFSEVLGDGSAAIYLYDNVYDGADLTTCAFENIQPLIAHSLERVEACGCTEDTGCFRCITNPRIDECSSKKAAITLLTSIRNIIATESPQMTELRPESGMLFGPEVIAACPCCNSSTSKGDRFCKNCGQKLA